MCCNVLFYKEETSHAQPVLRGDEKQLSQGTHKHSMLLYHEIALRRSHTVKGNNKL